MSENLSAQAQKLVARAGERNEKYDALLNRVLAPAFKNKPLLNTKPTSHVEGAILKKIIDFEISSHRGHPEWTFANAGLSRLSDDFLLLREYIHSSQSDSFKKVCDRWGHFALSEAENAELDAMTDAGARIEARLNKVRPQFQPLWSFFVALCHVLQEGENSLAALDAFWLGLIDEVIGEAQSCPRLFSEFKPDPPTAPAVPAVEVPAPAPVS